MFRSLLILLLLGFTCPVVYAQQSYSLAGKIEVCYETELKESISKNPVNLILSSTSTNKVFSGVAVNTGTFSFQQLPADTYQLKATLLGFPDNDTTIVINENINGLTFCIDKAYRLTTEDSITHYKNKALADIKAGRPKIIEWTAWSITKDPFTKLNPKVKKKYGFEYEMMGCVRQENREEIVLVQLWQAYNKVIYQHLEDKHGPDWWKSIKHERTKALKTN